MENSYFLGNRLKTVDAMSRGLEKRRLGTSGLETFWDLAVWKLDEIGDLETIPSLAVNYYDFSCDEITKSIDLSLRRVPIIWVVWIPSPMFIPRLYVLC